MGWLNSDREVIGNETVTDDNARTQLNPLDRLKILQHQKTKQGDKEV